MNTREHMIVVGPAPHREREGYLKGLSDAEAKALEVRLRAILSEYEVEVHVEPIIVHSQ